MRMETYVSAYGKTCQAIGRYQTILDDSRLRLTQDGMIAMARLSDRMRLRTKLEAKLKSYHEIKVPFYGYWWLGR